MIDTEVIKKEILEYITKRYSKNDKLQNIILKVKSEIEKLVSTEGLESKNNLETFYNIWINHKGKTGHTNEINSWTAYFLGMTDSKPIKKEFLPDRRAFARAGLPDIDTDFDYENRDDV